MRLTRRLSSPGSGAQLPGLKQDSVLHRIVGLLINTLLWGLGAIALALGLTCSSEEDRRDGDAHPRQ